jgi:hypothetical protein
MTIRANHGPPLTTLRHFAEIFNKLWGSTARILVAIYARIDRKSLYGHTLRVGGRRRFDFGGTASYSCEIPFTGGCFSEQSIMTDGWDKKATKLNLKNAHQWHLATSA